MHVAKETKHPISREILTATRKHVNPGMQIVITDFLLTRLEVITMHGSTAHC